MKSIKLTLGLIAILMVASIVVTTLKWERHQAEQACNIAVIPIIGDIVSYAGDKDDSVEGQTARSTNPDQTLAALRRAENDPHILGILATIDSGGGSMTAGEAISTAFKASRLPIVAQIREFGCSAAYLIATSAQTVIASRFSEVGSIGVTMSYLDRSEKNTKEGLNYVPLASAKFKDYGTLNKPLTPEERRLFERNLVIWHDYFVQLVAENRHLPVKQIERLADGSSMPGSLALENKLVDQLGGQEAARAWFAKHLGIGQQEIVFCE